MGFRPRIAVVVRQAAAQKTLVRIPQGEYEEEMRLRRPAVPVAGGTDAGVLCLVPCFSACSDIWIGQ